MDIYQKADIELAELLGWTSTGYPDKDTAQMMYFVPGERIWDIPSWTQSNEKAFKLMIEHSISVMINKNNISTYAGNMDTVLYSERFDYITDKFLAMRYMTVISVIKKLKWINE
jgi:hypothetical protein